MMQNTSPELLRAYARYQPDGQPVCRNAANLMKLRQETQSGAIKNGSGPCCRLGGPTFWRWAYKFVVAKVHGI